MVIRLQLNFFRPSMVFRGEPPRLFPSSRPKIGSPLVPRSCVHLAFASTQYPPSFPRTARPNESALALGVHESIRSLSTVFSFAFVPYTRVNTPDLCFSLLPRFLVPLGNFMYVHSFAIHRHSYTYHLVPPPLPGPPPCFFLTAPFAGYPNRYPQVKTAGTTGVRHQAVLAQLSPSSPTIPLGLLCELARWLFGCPSAFRPLDFQFSVFVFPPPPTGTFF